MEAVAPSFSATDIPSDAATFAATDKRTDASADEISDAVSDATSHGTPDEQRRTNSGADGLLCLGLEIRDGTE